MNSVILSLWWELTLFLICLNSKYFLLCFLWILLLSSASGFLVYLVLANTTLKVRSSATVSSLVLCPSNLSSLDSQLYWFNSGVPLCSPWFSSMCYKLETLSNQLVGILWGLPDFFPPLSRITILCCSILSVLELFFIYYVFLFLVVLGGRVGQL